MGSVPILASAISINAFANADADADADANAQWEQALRFFLTELLRLQLRLSEVLVTVKPFTFAIAITIVTALPNGFPFIEIETDHN